MHVSEVRGIGPKKADLLKSMGIVTLGDMLAHYPYAYEDRSRVTPIAEASEGAACYIRAVVLKISKNFAYGRNKQMLRLTAADDSGTVEIIFFQASYYERSFQTDESYYFYGRVTKGKNGLQMVHPEFERDPGHFESSILPIYRTTKGVTQKDMRKISGFALSQNLSVTETLPRYLIEKNNICSREFALKNIHFPEDKMSFRMAKYRLVYEELFLLQTGLFLKGSSKLQAGDGIEFPHDRTVYEFIERLPYELTGAQMRVIREISNDMESPSPMQRLVQGDVGSGKTVVAAAALYKAAKNGCQGVMMAPTELLAAQHLKTFQELYEGTGIRLGFLTSALRKKEREETLRDLAEGKIDVLIGTHAVIQDAVEFRNLALVITDEQHRFGVDQRKKLAAKGRNPDILVMTATPIPRTLAVILFGDLDISAIDELPPGRKAVETKAVTARQRKKVYEFAGRQIEEGRQVYVVAPLIEDSETVDASSAVALYHELQGVFPGRNVALVHGGMRQEEKERVMQAFAEGAVDLLAATVVIEVGINVPNATVMIIENSERFGLAQLHQLRGRVGRGEHPSYCFLITDSKAELGRRRAKIIESSSDGFAIAEKDLQMRGPGEFFGTKQHGLPELTVADLVRHLPILNGLREDVKEILQRDPRLRLPENRLIAEGVARMFRGVGGIGL